MWLDVQNEFQRTREKVAAPRLCETEEAGIGACAAVRSFGEEHYREFPTLNFPSSSPILRDARMQAFTGRRSAVAAASMSTFDAGLCS